MGKHNFLEILEGLDRRILARTTTSPGAEQRRERPEIGMQVAEADLVVSQIFGRGVHAGELLGIPATNREVETEGIAIHRIRDDKIVEYWSVTDIARVLQQVGVLPGPPS